MESEQRHHSQRRLKTRSLRTSEQTALPANARHFETHSEQYDEWLDRHDMLYRAEVDAVRPIQ